MLVIAAAVAVTVWTTYLFSTWPPEPPSGSPTAASVEPSRPTEASPIPEATQDGPTVLVVVGDSFSAGTDQNSGPEWPELLGERLGWEVVVEAAPRTGYVDSGRGKDFGDRVDEVAEHSADVVLLAGGISDLRDDPDDVAAAAEELVGRLRQQLLDTRVVLASPFSNGAPGPVTTRLAKGLEAVARDVAVTYLDLTGYLPFGSDLIGDDGVHPSDKGHRRIARLLEQDLTEADLRGP